MRSLYNQMVADQQNAMSMMSAMANPSTPTEVVVKSVEALMNVRLGVTHGYHIRVFAEHIKEVDRTRYTLAVENKSEKVFEEHFDDYRDILSDEVIAKLMLIVK